MYRKTSSMTFPGISFASLIIDAITAEKPPCVHVARSESGAERQWSKWAQPSVWRMTLTDLTDRDLKAIHVFLDAVASERTWRIQSAAYQFRRCTLVDAHVPLQQERAGGAGWIVFRGIRSEDWPRPSARDGMREGD